MEFISLPNKDFLVPALCPNCSVANNPFTAEIAKLSIQEGHSIAYHHRCNVCNKYHVTLQEVTESGNHTVLLCYPDKTPTSHIDNLFITHTPSFVSVYSEAQRAEQEKYHKLAGMGYRSSIECLIKDYALLFELDTIENISKMNFNNCINKYLKEDELLQNAVHTVRKIGNDYTHWGNTYDMPLETLKSYVEIVISIFKSKLMMKFSPV